MFQSITVFGFTQVDLQQDVDFEWQTRITLGCGYAVFSSDPYIFN
jgi:hypothetical protein